MNISKELHDAMVEMGFAFDKIGINQTAPNFLFARRQCEVLGKEFSIRVPNKKDVGISFVIGLLSQEAHQYGWSKGYNDGKKEVGNYLKSLTD